MFTTPPIMENAIPSAGLAAVMKNDCKATPKRVSGEMIKEICIPLKVDRLGNITYIGTEFIPKR